MMSSDVPLKQTDWSRSPLDTDVIGELIDARTASTFVHNRGVWNLSTAIQVTLNVRIPATSYLVPLFTFVYIVLFTLLLPYNLDVPCYLTNRKRYCSVWPEKDKDSLHWSRTWLNLRHLDPPVPHTFSTVNANRLSTDSNTFIAKKALRTPPTRNPRAEPPTLRPIGVINWGNMWQRRSVYMAQAISTCQLPAIACSGGVPHRHTPRARCSWTMSSCMSPSLHVSA
jgi:hypothetical protein